MVPIPIFIQDGAQSAYDEALLVTFLTGVGTLVGGTPREARTQGA
jgi:hypothetical protein